MVKLYILLKMAIHISKWILCSCLASIFSFLKRILFRKSSKQKMDLPTAKRQRPDGQEALQDGEGEQLQNWDSWEEGGMTGVTVDSGNAEGDVNPDQMEQDFFSDMTPAFKKAALIRKKANKTVVGYVASNSGVSNRLTMGVDDTAALTDELGAWTETGGGWEDGAGDEDMVQEADNVIREKREGERRKRMAEQQKKKAEREVQRANQKGPSKLAVKLS